MNAALPGQPALDRFAEVDAWVFDLDNTLYPRHTDLFRQVDVRIREFVQRALSFVERAADPVDLFIGHHVAVLAFDLGQAFVVGFLERLESAQEIVERFLDLKAVCGVLGFEGFGFEIHSVSFLVKREGQELPCARYVRAALSSFRRP